MKIVTCSLPNAGTEINGVVFAQGQDNTMVSVPVEDAVAAQFARIPGYSVANAPEAPAKSTRKSKESL